MIIFYQRNLSFVNKCLLCCGKWRAGLCRPTARYRWRFLKILAFRRRPVNFAVAKRLRGLGMF
jgi:hypothetical protein